MAASDFFLTIQKGTESFLSYRKRRKRIKKEKQKGVNVILDWIGAFLWAAGMVLLINQYLFQAYQIPSGSMIDTLRIGDRLFVNKLVYGPELLPGLVKLPSPIKPERNQIIIFENPAYITRGPVFDIAQRIIFMLTLSFIDIDRDEYGDPKPHFLIKRAVGMGGDHFASDQGNMRIRFAGENRWVDEKDFHSLSGYTHKIGRLMDSQYYPALEAAGKAAAFGDIGLPIPVELSEQGAQANYLQYPDLLAYEKYRLEMLCTAYPHNPNYRSRLAQHNQGWYIPESRIFPLGDNRDNSRDGRYFGPVRSDRILGKASFTFWPLSRMGSIR
jgi:signal peptidase I